MNIFIFAVERDGIIAEDLCNALAGKSHSVMYNTNTNIFTIPYPDTIDELMLYDIIVPIITFNTSGNDVFYGDIDAALEHYTDYGARVMPVVIGVNCSIEGTKPLFLDTGDVIEIVKGIEASK